MEQWWITQFDCASPSNYVQGRQVSGVEWNIIVGYLDMFPVWMKAVVAVKYSLYADSCSRSISIRWYRPIILYWRTSKTNRQFSTHKSLS